MGDRVVRSTPDTLSNESAQADADLPTTAAPALDSESSRDALQRAWLRNLDAALKHVSSQDTGNVGFLGSHTEPPRLSTSHQTELSSAPRAFPKAPRGPRPLQSHPLPAAADSTPADLPDPFADDDPVLLLRRPRDPLPAPSHQPSGSRDHGPPKFRLRFPARSGEAKYKAKALRLARQKSSTAPQGLDRLYVLSDHQSRHGIPSEPLDSDGPPPPPRGSWPVRSLLPPLPPSPSPLRDEGRKTDARPPAPPTRQDYNAIATMNGVNGGNMGVGIVGPTPAGHQTELNYIYAMVEDLSRQLSDNRRVLEEVVSLVGKIRSKARAQNVSNEEIITNAEDLNPENLDVLVSALSEALDRATHERDTNMALLQQYAAVLGTMVRQAHEYKARNVSDVSAWHRSYREQLAEAREENSRLREQVWDMQERGGRLNELARRFRARYDAEPSRYESRVEHAALRQEVRFWKRMAMPEIPDDDPCWSDDDDLIDPAETKRLAEVERAAAALAAEQQLKMQLEEEQAAMDQESQQQQQQFQDYQQQQDELGSNTVPTQGPGDGSTVNGQPQHGRGSILGSFNPSESSQNQQQSDTKGQQQQAGVGFSMGGVAMQRDDPNL
ncbi:hypothetical protein RB595_002526 [Gaeumannomyces hyphopodioides]